MPYCFRLLVVSSAIMSLGFLPLLGFAQDAIAAETSVDLVPEPPEELEAVTNPGEPILYTVRLQVDGNLVGRIRMVSEAGKESIVPSRVDFYQGGELFVSTYTDDAGFFQAVGLKPGRYLADVLSELGRAEFEIELLPYVASASPEELLLDAIVSPIAMNDYLLDRNSTLIDGGFGGGCCCGGGGHGGLGWLGLAGLAGLAGLGGDGGGGDTPPPAVSPAAP